MSTGWVSVRQTGQLWIDVSIPVEEYEKLCASEPWRGAALAVHAARMQSGGELCLMLGRAKETGFAKGEWKFASQAKQPTRARVVVPAKRVKDFRGWGVCSSSEAVYTASADGTRLLVSYPKEPKTPRLRRRRGGDVVEAPAQARNGLSVEATPQALPRQPIVVELLGVLYSGEVELSEAFATIVGLGLKPTQSPSATRPG